MTQFDYVKTRREDVDPIPNQSLVKVFMRWFTRLNVWVFKLSRGRLMKNFPGGHPICVVGTTGRKSGKRREIALIHLPWRDGILLVASQGGMETNPVWYYNIKANPDIDVMVGGQHRHMVARQASEEEKRELWPHLLSLYPDFDEYQARTDRDIPVFICMPR
ncbi:MAG: nitroreductase family deazaflavin-dependent oxidoreductase [Haliea sp.]|uniref:nitroreductase family deazaflavin-dependent oxidoreductase n=1 Tax=Haliea sp. TaxID=1932666 RepID=UPI0032EA9343